MKSLLTLAFALLAFMPQSHATDEAAMEEKPVPVVKAVSFHSDSCGACKVLRPKMMKAMGAVNMDKIDVIKFDFTNKETIEATKALAAEKGLTDLLQKYGAKTGFVVLVDARGKQVETIKFDDDPEDIAEDLVELILDAS
jgi:thiol-disulfide isomerase/thioredoxin